MQATVAGPRCVLKLLLRILQEDLQITNMVYEASRLLAFPHRVPSEPGCRLTTAAARGERGGEHSRVPKWVRGAVPMAAREHFRVFKSGRRGKRRAPRTL